MEGGIVATSRFKNGADWKIGLICCVNSDAKVSMAFIFICTELRRSTSFTYDIESLVSIYEVTNISYSTLRGL